MAVRQRLGKAQIAALKPGEVVWDSALVGFGARRQKSAVVSYILQLRLPGGQQRKITIGRHGQPWTPDTARTEAKRQLGAIASGVDPVIARKAEQTAAMTVSDLCAAYMVDARAGRLLTRQRRPKKDSTLETDQGRIDRHIKPLIGSLKVVSVTRDDVERFMHSVAEGETALPRGHRSRVRGGRGTASRTTGFLGAVFAYAVRKGIRPDNPKVGVVRFADGKRDRRLAVEEYKGLRAGFLAAEGSGMWPPALAAVRFALFTGWRRSEVLGLMWSDIDVDRRVAVLPDTKTGRSVRVLSSLACSIVDLQPRVHERVFAPARRDGAMNGFSSFLARICAAGGLPADVTSHVFRHSFASVANDLGYSEATIGALLGHARQGVTARYIHSRDALLVTAADSVANEIQTLIG